MSQNKSTASVSNGPGNKDLSCLRCRKKKAKCSKTRPACTRCARSNQPCEYPDAPPNLTDLSQKVLSLYDTLRELEDKFMLQYTAQEQEQTEMTRTGEKKRRRQSSSTSSSNPKSPPDDMPSIETLSLFNPIIKRPRRQQYNEDDEQDQQPRQVATLPPGNWSMSLTSNGLSLHAVARNMIEFSTFAKDFSHQLRNNDPENKLTKSWEWYEEETIEDEDDDPLDEDEYLVTVPVYSLPSLLGHHNNNNNNNNNNSFVHNISTTTKSLNDNVNNENDEDDDDDTPFKNRIQPILDDIINYLRQTYDVLSMDEYPIHLYHITTLLQQLHPFIPFDQKLTISSSTRPIQLICIITGYAASIQLLSPNQEQSQSTELVEDCINYATTMLIELVFQRQKDVNPLPIVACAALLAWMGRSDMAHLAIRALCGSDDWDENNKQWQHLAASLLYYEVYSTTFSCRRTKRKNHHEIGEAETWLLQSAKRLIQQQAPSPSDIPISHYYYASSLGLETELVCLLKQVFALFYDKDGNNSINNNGNGIRKVDVDDVLKLVRNIEEWEHQLPKWTQWTSSKANISSHDTNKNSNNDNNCTLAPRWSKLKMHIHLIHNIVKILLFRPFSIEPFGHQRQHQQQHDAGHGEGGGQEDDGNELLQTHTRTTFLDLSLAAADRVTLCINHLHDRNKKMEDADDEWIQAGYHLAQDVIRRVKDAFPCDDELLITVQEIQSRLVQVESIEPSTTLSL